MVMDKPKQKQAFSSSRKLSDNIGLWHKHAQPNECQTHTRCANKPPILSKYLVCKIEGWVLFFCQNPGRLLVRGLLSSCLLCVTLIPTQGFLFSYSEVIICWSAYH